MTNEHLQNIRRGLAANLRALPDCQVSPYLLDSPTGPSLQVAGFDGIDFQQSFGRTTMLQVVVEGVTPLAGGSRGAYERFDEWILGDLSVQDVLEADQTLTSRLRDNGSVLENQDPVADSVAVQEFRGYRRVRVANNIEVLLGDWLLEVLTSG